MSLSSSGTRQNDQPGVWGRHEKLPYFTDEHGRVIWTRGINLASSVKCPQGLPTQSPHATDPDIPISFTGKPFPLEDARQHFARLQSFGYNLLRFLVSWEAIEHYGPGVYDYEYINYVVQLLKIGQEYGIKVYIDPHQDVWSRVCGGDGAPTWTTGLVGLDHTAFKEAGAALVQSQFRDGDEQGNPHRIGKGRDPALEFPQMCWPTNCGKLAAATMFTLFFAGKAYCPEYLIKIPLGDADRAVHVQDMLQQCYFNALKELALSIDKAGLHDTVVIGYETMNEVCPGYIGFSDISKLPNMNGLKNRFTPTPLESFLLGVGKACEVDYYKLTMFGPKLDGKRRLQGRIVWQTPPTVDHLIRVGLQRRHEACADDSAANKSLFDRLRVFSVADEGKSQNFLSKRFSEANLGCLWAASGLYEPAGRKVLRPDHFKVTSRAGEDPNAQHHGYYIVEYYRAHVKLLRELLPTIHVFIGVEPVPGSPLNTLVHSHGMEMARDSALPANSREFLHKLAYERTTNTDQKYHEFIGREVYAPHFYEGLSLLQKKLQFFSIEVDALIRGEKNILRCIGFGRSGLRRVVANSIEGFHQDARHCLGPDAPVIVGEVGIPMDLNGGKAFTDGKYTDQFVLVDALQRGLENALMGHSWWAYNPENSHTWGDNWNGEDLSVICRSDAMSGYKYTAPSISSRRTAGPISPTSPQEQIFPGTIAELSRFARILPAFVRPTPIKTPGTPLSFKFDSTTGVLTYTFKPHRLDTTQSAQSKPQTWNDWLELINTHTSDERICEFFVPLCWFDKWDNVDVRADKGSWCWDVWRQRVYWLVSDSAFTRDESVTITIRTRVRHYPSRLLDRMWLSLTECISPQPTLHYVNEKNLATFPEVSSDACVRYLLDDLKLEKLAIDDLIAHVAELKDPTAASGRRTSTSFHSGTVEPEPEHFKLSQGFKKNEWDVLLAKDFVVRLKIDGRTCNILKMEGPAVPGN